MRPQRRGRTRTACRASQRRRPLRRHLGPLGATWGATSAPLGHSCHLRYQCARERDGQQRTGRSETMRLLLRLSAALGVTLAAAFAAALPSAAQDYPNRSVKIIVPFGAGGPADVFARIIGHHLQETLKQSFVIEN